MSSKWTLIGTNALETWNPENVATDPKEKARLRYERKKKTFKWGIYIDRMKVEKPKKNFKKEEKDLLELD